MPCRAVPCRDAAYVTCDATSRICSLARDPPGTMPAMRRLQRDVRRLLPLAFLVGCSLATIVYLRSQQHGRVLSESYHRRKVGSIDERPGGSSSRETPTGTGAARPQTRLER